jgi:hypothetical protein
MTLCVPIISRKKYMTIGRLNGICKKNEPTLRFLLGLGAARRYFFWKVRR